MKIFEKLKTEKGNFWKSDPERKEQEIPGIILTFVYLEWIIFHFTYQSLRMQKQGKGGKIIFVCLYQTINFI